jgi:hypothetical protein
MDISLSLYLSEFSSKTQKIVDPKSSLYFQGPTPYNLPK